MMLKKEVIAGKLINIDETPVQVLNEPDKSNQSKSYMWIFRGGTPEAPGIIFEYRPSRQATWLLILLKDMKALSRQMAIKAMILLTTSKKFSIWDALPRRRKFVAVEKAAGKPADATRQTITGQALKYIRKLYEIGVRPKKKG
jgi:transposase